MTLNESATFVVSMVFAILTFSSMQMFKSQLQASQAMTIVGGLGGSLIFVFVLTALGNLEKTVFGKGFQTQWFEVALSLIAAVMASASVHRVAASTSLLFSLAMLYGMFKIAQDTYGGVAVTSEKSKRKK